MLSRHVGTEPKPCIGVVLAGGRSSRMGRDKALLVWRGRPLVEHQIAVLHAAGVDSVQVSGERPNYKGVVDAVSQMGPLGGLAGIAAAHSGDAELLVIPVDMPLLQPALLRRLRTEQAQAPCLCFAGQVLPTRLRLDAHSRGVLRELLRAADPQRRSLRALQLALGAGEIPLRADESVQFMDCNTEAVWNEVAG